MFEMPFFRCILDMLPSCLRAQPLRRRPVQHDRHSDDTMDTRLESAESAFASQPGLRVFKIKHSGTSGLVTVIMRRGGLYMAAWVSEADLRAAVRMRICCDYDNLFARSVTTVVGGDNTPRRALRSVYRASLVEFDPHPMTRTYGWEFELCTMAAARRLSDLIIGGARQARLRLPALEYARCMQCENLVLAAAPLNLAAEATRGLLVTQTSRLRETNDEALGLQTRPRGRVDDWGRV
jgi:hypothetical protein